MRVGRWWSRICGGSCADLMFELEDYRGAFERFSELYDIRADMLGAEHPSAPLPLLLSCPPMLLLPLLGTCRFLRFYVQTCSSP